ncbi:MAG: molecular chaperone HtpG [Bacteroidetes bacterium]|nr:molecular chaperone HtpG [Bacteroidota bacterium]
MAKKEKLAAETGEISIHTENILPIIKKWLYADHEIFLRELVSNGVDAVSKLKHLSSLGEYSGEVKGKVVVSFDKDKKEIRIKDDGIGMTSEEIKKYINQIAFSGAEEFVAKYKKDDANSGIIGHFGLGFYSAFMVSETVEIHTKSYTGTPAAHWVSDGSTKFTIDASDKSDRGTEIILHVDKDNEDFLESYKIKEILNKYCRFLPVEVEFEGEVINETHPAWIKAPSEVKEEEYREFYHKLHGYGPDPLFWIHLNVDYPFRLTGILYFPKIVNEMEINKGQIQLYCQQVYVSNNVNDILPEFLTLLRGVIDSPDIPLNVSRSFLQNDRNVKKISGHITKKIADKLNELHQNDRANYEKYWKDIAPFVKYGMVTDESFLDRVQDAVLLEKPDGGFVSVKEYTEANKETQKGDQDKVVILYTNDKDKQATYLDQVNEKGYQAVVLDHLIDNHFISALERKRTDVKFTRVDANVVDKLINPNALTVEVNKEQASVLEKVFRSIIPNEKVKISVENLTSSDIPAKVIVSEESRRLKEMMKAMTVMQGDKSTDDLFDESTLVVNVNNDLVRKMLILEGTRPELVKELAEQVWDLASMAQAPLNGARMSAFVRRNNKLMSLLS